MEEQRRARSAAEKKAGGPGRGVRASVWGAILQEKYLPVVSGCRPKRPVVLLRNRDLSCLLIGLAILSVSFEEASRRKKLP